MKKYKVKAVFESAKHFDEKLYNLELELKKNIEVDKVNFSSYTVSMTAYTDDIFLINALAYKAKCYDLDFFFIITDYEEVFYTNDVDGTYFSTLFYVDANLPKTIIKAEFDSETDIIDDIQEFMNSEYSDLNNALKAINEYIKTIDKDCYYIVKKYTVFENEADWINALKITR